MPPTWNQSRTAIITGGASGIGLAIARLNDIAAACAFLVSDAAGYITGQVIGVNGGRTV
jgi:NAD(P)-dependent dehydrogenase (short-subunit alcohol dehydrogenase family)